MANVDFAGMLREPTELELHRASRFVRGTLPDLDMTPPFDEFATLSIARFTVGLGAEGLPLHLEDDVVLGSGQRVTAVSVLMDASVERTLADLNLDPEDDTVRAACAQIALGAGLLAAMRTGDIRTNG